jgi:hypothetical protein
VSDTHDIVAAATADLNAAADDANVNDGGDTGEAPAELDTTSFTPDGDASPDAGPESLTTEAATEDVTVESPAPPAAPAEPQVVAPGTETEEQSLRAIEQELIAKNPNLKKGRIPTARHQAILTRDRRRAEAQIAELTPLKELAQQFQSEDTQVRLKVANLMEKDPEALVHKVLMHDPRYRAIFESFAKPAAAPAAAPAPQSAPPAPTEKPAADVLLPDGSVGYSAQRASELIEWRIAQERTAAEQREAALAKRIEQFEQQFEPIVREREDTAQFNAAVTRQRGVLEDARTNWPGFKDHEAAVRAEMFKPGNERMTLDQAYRKVVVPTLAVQRDQLRATLRAEILAEINKARPVVTRQGTPDVSAPNPASMTTDQIVRAATRSLNANQ